MEAEKEQGGARDSAGSVCVWAPPIHGETGNGRWSWVKEVLASRIREDAEGTGLLSKMALALHS